MTQLTDDCFAFGGSMLSIDAALELMRTRVAAVAATETVPLDEALGRILAQDVRAGVAVPGFDNSAVDGYAVRHGDLSPGVDSVMSVSVRVPAGAVGIADIAPGTTARIFTGAPMPSGADTVYMQEDVRLEGDRVILPAGLKAGANRRFAGEDFAKDSLVVAGGTRLDPRHLAAFAAVGLSEAGVRRRLRVALFSTGDELALPGEVLRPGAQYDSNRAQLAALLRLRGIAVSDLGILRDRRDGIVAALDQAARSHDLILTSGGVSTGEEDHVKQAVETLGHLNFWRLAIKPGRPLALGQIGHAVFVGLPGNPVASFVTFVRLAGPLIDHLSGMRSQPVYPVPAVADFSYRKKAGRREYVRCTILGSEGGTLRLGKFENDGAALISSLVGTDGLAELDEEVTTLSPGMPVSFLPYRSLF